MDCSLWLNHRKVNTAREIAENLDIAALRGYFLGGSLVGWLREHDGEELACRLEQLDPKAPDLNRQLAELFAREISDKIYIPIEIKPVMDGSLSALPLYSMNGSFIGSFGSSFALGSGEYLFGSFGYNLGSYSFGSFGYNLGSYSFGSFGYNLGSWSWEWEWEFGSGYYFGRSGGSFSLGSGAYLFGSFGYNLGSYSFGSFGFNLGSWSWEWEWEFGSGYYLGGSGGSFSLGSGAYLFGSAGYLSGSFTFGSAEYLLGSFPGSFGSYRIGSYNIGSFDAEAFRAVFGITAEEYDKILLNSLKGCPLNRFGYGIHII